MKRSLLVVLTAVMLAAVFFMPTEAEAKPHQLSWTWPTDNCDGTALDPGDLMESELIYSLSPMPMPSDTDGACEPTGDPGPPAGALTVPIPITDNVVQLNLQPGQTYYARIRVSAYNSTNWSVWSGQVQFTVPYGRPNRVILSDGWKRWEYYPISYSVLIKKKTS